MTQQQQADFPDKPFLHANTADFMGKLVAFYVRRNVSRDHSLRAAFGDYRLNPFDGIPDDLLVTYKLLSGMQRVNNLIQLAAYHASRKLEAKQRRLKEIRLQVESSMSGLDRAQKRDLLTEALTIQDEIEDIAALMRTMAGEGLDDGPTET